MVHVTVWAYLDPGAGSMALQAILASAAGSLVLIRLCWNRLLVALRLRSKVASVPESTEVSR